MKSLCIHGTWVNLYFDGNVQINSDDEETRIYVMKYLVEEGFFEQPFLQDMY